MPSDADYYALFHVRAALHLDFTECGGWKPPARTDAGAPEPSLDENDDPPDQVKKTDAAAAIGMHKSASTASLQDQENTGRNDADYGVENEGADTRVNKRVAAVDAGSSISSSRSRNAEQMNVEDEHPAKRRREDQQPFTK
ncbi:unnamed protein product [Amoebophrya sp. A120]|nr:unnamed protein product [Amoebophrya sp. A120]|eukprot:GSA120T00018619001.1